MANYVAEKDLAIPPHHPMRRERQMTEHWRPPPTRKEVEQCIRLFNATARLFQDVNLLFESLNEREVVQDCTLASEPKPEPAEAEKGPLIILGAKNDPQRVVIDESGHVGPSILLESMFPSFCTVKKENGGYSLPDSNGFALGLRELVLSLVQSGREDFSVNEDGDYAIQPAEVEKLKTILEDGSGYDASSEEHERPPRT